MISVCISFQDISESGTGSRYGGELRVAVQVGEKTTKFEPVEDILFNPFII
jgi:hypothetical protein